MRNRWVLVDGYSVLHAWLRFASRKMRQQSLHQRREALVGVLRQYADATGGKLTVVFDGYAAKHKPEGSEVTHGIERLVFRAGQDGGRCD